MTDAELLTDFLVHHDQSAFELLVRRHGPMVLNVCRDVLAESHDADDAFQATFMILIRNASAIRDRSSLGPWLYEVAWKASRRSKQQARRRNAMQRQVSTMDSAASFDPDQTQLELRPVLHAEIHQLPNRLRDAIVLCYLEGFAVEAAAKRLDCPVGTLKSRLSKGREILRSRLTRRGLGVTAVLLLLAWLTDEASAGAEVPEVLVESTIQSGLKALAARSSLSRFVQETRLDRPWIGRITSGALLLMILTITVPVVRWSSYSLTPRASAATIRDAGLSENPPTSDLPSCHALGDLEENVLTR